MGQGETKRLPGQTNLSHRMKIMEEPTKGSGSPCSPSAESPELTDTGREARHGAEARAQYKKPSTVSPEHTTTFEEVK